MECDKEGTIYHHLKMVEIKAPLEIFDTELRQQIQQFCLKDHKYFSFYQDQLSVQGIYNSLCLAHFHIIVFLQMS